MVNKRSAHWYDIFNASLELLGSKCIGLAFRSCSLSRQTLHFELSANLDLMVYKNYAHFVLEFSLG